jgi:hypothetical protein
MEHVSLHAPHGTGDGNGVLMDIPPKEKHESQRCWMCGKYRGYIGGYWGYECISCEVMWGRIPIHPKRTPPPKDAIQ